MLMMTWTDVLEKDVLECRMVGLIEAETGEARPLCVDDRKGR